MHRLPRDLLWAVLIATVVQYSEAYERPAHAPSPTRWSIEGGYGARLWDAQGNSEQQAYEEKAKLGWMFGGDVAVFPMQNFGVGFAYYRFLSSTTDSDYGFYDGTRGKSTDTYLIEYVGPSLYFKQDFSRITTLAQFGVGVIYYDNQHQASDFPGVLQGATPGAFVSLSADYMLTSWFAIGITTRVLYGQIDKLAYNGIDIPFDPISLTRVDVAGGIRFYP